MRVPLSWLRELVDVDASVDDLAAKLSTSGLAVEEILRPGEGVAGIVAGRVLDVRDHPTSNKPLVLVTADVGRGETLEIVCGARNFGAGDVVPVAVVGTRMPDGMEIKRAKLAGQTSNGMLCSARELGLSDDHSGILLLDAEVGEDVGELLRDVVFDIDVTPNRPDCLSILGVAREVAALYGSSVRMPKSETTRAGAPGATVTVEDATGCPRYRADVVTGVDPAARSPWWMRRRLLAAGMRPISGIVDVTNYVLLELGHPLHAFDLAGLTGSAIVVRDARPGERITTLDGAERVLEPGDVLICDADRPVALAGIMGGADSEVSASTTGILLESAAFDPRRILRTARRVGLRTEASVRFERGVDLEAIPAASERAVSLITAVAGGASTGSIDLYPHPAPRPRIDVSVARANALIGIDASASDVTSMLVALGCEVAGDATLTVSPPSWRVDLSIEEDVVEEIARLYGYDRVPSRLPPGGRRGGLTADQTLRRLARRALLGAGLSEAQTLSLLAPDAADRLGLGRDHPWRSVVRIANPLSEEESVLRPSLLPGLMLAARRNVSRRAPGVALFEIGAVFAPSSGELPVETLEVAWIMTGAAPEGWHRSRSYDFFDAKGALESLAQALGVRDLRVEPGEAGEPYHPARSALVYAGDAPAGELGEIAPRAAAALDLTGRVAVARLDLGVLLGAATPAAAVPLPKLPPLTRDLALVVDASAADVEGVIREAGGPLLESVRLFDVYRGEQAGDGRVSLAWSLTFRDAERTLTDAEVEPAMVAIAAAASARGWAVRT